MLMVAMGACMLCLRLKSAPLSLRRFLQAHQLAMSFKRKVESMILCADQQFFLLGKEYYDAFLIFAFSISCSSMFIYFN